MSGYYTQINTTIAGGTWTHFALKPVLYAIEIVRVEYVGNSTGNFSRFASSSVTGGTAITPSPFRDGTAPASTTVRYGSLTISGTETKYCVANSIPSPWEPKFSLTVKPGEVFAVYGTSANMISAVVYFDEQHVARST